MCVHSYFQRSITEKEEKYKPFKDLIKGVICKIKHTYVRICRLPSDVRAIKLPGSHVQSNMLNLTLYN